MNISEWIEDSTKKLEQAGIATARLDCLVLLEDATDKDRSYLLAHEDEVIDAETLSGLNSQIRRRSRHKPLAYIRGKSEFYGREFLVNGHTLEPRPETETVIELLKELGVGSWELGNIIDVGTGSGCIAITAKLELPRLKVVAVDIDKKCIETAQKNAKKLGADIEFYQGDLLEPIPHSYFSLPYSLLANLPYVPDSHTINEAAMHEPKIAIFGGTDGLDLYRRLFEQIARERPQYVLTESLPFQHRELENIALQSGFTLSKTTDLIQVFTPS